MGAIFSGRFDGYFGNSKELENTLLILTSTSLDRNYQLFPFDRLSLPKLGDSRKNNIMSVFSISCFGLFKLRSGIKVQNGQLTSCHHS